MQTGAMEKNLESALQERFGDEAASLGRLVRICLEEVNPRYEDIDLPADIKQECLLTAFSERLVIPARSGPHGGWDDRSLQLAEGEYYMMPLVARHLMQQAAKEGSLAPEGALDEVLDSCMSQEAEPVARLVRGSRSHARQGRVEAGLFYEVARSAGLDLDLHHTLDTLVLLGVVSPSSQGTPHAGLAWYELHPCLLW